ncbi:protein kinase rad3 [Diaporthe amygdali]|uniref:protein kinase rad3 n=1 Tax=Phomopsis amygdali TaxID=1214568 RepID=UPI0022FF0573|nr:protein kinase rad3 [Diaporthe amygdali]KAJ0123315.1 protein kinase rad3 [Diaporthe amygdali]
MAAESHNRAAPTSHNAGNPIANANGGPPPSTLAAQLAGNISTSAKSSRPDEASELKRLFEEIERVKNKPESLKTPDEHVEHNHMLIYVYARVILDALKWDDPFADREQLKADALTAIHFLKVTIAETPTVLTFTTNGSAFLHRGSEPLWVWLFPKLLRMLGHPRSIALLSPLESLFHFVLVTASTSGGLWNVCDPLFGYLQANFRSILAHLKLASPAAKGSVDIELPDHHTLDSLLPRGTSTDAVRCPAYTLGDADHALRHASCLLKILHSVAVPDGMPKQQVPPFIKHISWLVDCVEALNEEQRRWREYGNHNPVSLLKQALSLVSPLSGVEQVVLHKLYSVIVLLTADVVVHQTGASDHQQADASAMKVLALALVQVADVAAKHRPVAKLAAAQLLKALDQMLTEGIAGDASGDLQRSISLFREAVTLPVPQPFSPELSPGSFVDRDLRFKVQSITSKAHAPTDQKRAIKRRKIAQESSSMPHVLNQLSRVLPDGTLSLGSVGQPGLHCSFCSTADRTGPRPPCTDPVAVTLAGTIFTELIQMSAFRESRRPRVVAMIALRRIVVHSKIPDMLDLEKSAIGQWCLSTLQSSLRELRIAAGRAITLFLRPSVSQAVGVQILNRNTANALGFLRSISDKNEPNINETSLMAWGQLGRVVSDEGLNLVLVKMLEFLGHQNPIVSAVALNEITNLAASRRTTPRRLLEPFWRSLAYSIVKDMLTRPQTTQMVADLLRTSVTELLLLIQSHALPWLVLHRKRDIIQKFSEARRDEHLQDMFLDETNLSAILARLFVQDDANIEHLSMSALTDVCPTFRGTALTEVLKTSPVLTILELLRMSVEGNESTKASARSALTMVANLLVIVPRDGKRKGGHHIIGRFLREHALGLSARMVEVINNTSPVPPPMRERRLCIRAMEEMIVLAKEYMRIARPQISVCLLSALSLDELRTTAFACWHSMVTHVGEEDVEELIETTFFIIGQYWTCFAEESREKSKALLRFLLNNHEAVLNNTVSKLPSLSHISELSELWNTLNSRRPLLDSRAAFALYIERIRHENAGVVEKGLLELSEYLRQNQGYIQASAISEQPDSVVEDLARTLLDCTSKYNGINSNIARICAECIGLMGCLDSNRLETVREQREFIALSNFTDADETTDFAAFILEEVLVKSFVSTTDSSLQGFLSYVMQELLERCDYKTAVGLQGAEGERIYRKWLSMPESVRDVLLPFLTSRYKLAPMPSIKTEYPIFRTGRSYANWLRQFTLDLLHKGQNPFADIIFDPLCRAIRVKDLSVAIFMLPYLVVHITLGNKSTQQEKNAVWNELLCILKQDVPENASYLEREDKKLFCEAVFRVIDYAMRFLQLKRSSRLSKTDENNLALIQKRLDSIPPELVSQRAIDCKQYARALFHLEPHILRQQEEHGDDAENIQQALDSLQHVYAHIDEPDGLEGVSANLKVIDLKQQILSHRKAGRWSRAQTWCEVQLAENPHNIDVQIDLLTCLKESGQYDVLLNHVGGMDTDGPWINKIAPFAVEAAWATGRWETLKKYLGSYKAGNHLDEFNLGVGSALLALKDGQIESFVNQIQDLKEKTASSMSMSATASLQAAHDAMLRCHVLADLEIIAGDHKRGASDQQQVMTSLDRRLEVLGAYVGNKQYVLGIRRAAMELMRPKFSDGDISSLWLSSARLARKANSLHQSFNAVLHASQLGDGSATIENARLLWKEGHHRKAIQILENAIQTNSFIGYNLGPAAPTSSKGPEVQRNLLTARAHLLLAKWQDSAGQTHASALRAQYQQAAKTHAMWEKGHYYLGRHYKKVLESEKALSPDEQSDEYLTGETAKLVIENYLRSLNYGTKYLYQTLPRILSLWMDLGAQIDKAPEGKISVSRELSQRRKTLLHELNKYFYKHMQRMPAYIFYTAMPQIVARIAHPNPDIFTHLQHIIIKVVEAHPRQALWGLFAIMTSKQSSDRTRRGIQLLTQLRNSSGKRVDGSSYDLRQLLRMGEKLAEQLLLACNNGDFQSNRTTHASITRDLNFNHRCTPCPLVVPIEACLTATLPTLTDNIKKHKAFSRDVVAIDSFLDDVLVLGSLAKPRRLTARGTDGKLYNLLIKPKDDLRTDQRLMEFNSMINRSLKRDAESSRRQLYIRTYAVTPLNEECGILEWVDGLKTLRDILLGLYKPRGIIPNYAQIAQMMKEASASDKNITLFTEQVLGMFPPVLPSWFISQFPNPSAWFAARLKYTRSCAVMSMVGTILGLGDRHGENVLLEEGNGGVFHVDFNCLFDKGLTFAQPERVPFRLTHNMVAAMGIYGYEGPFRQCSELTLSILRQQEETLMTILEAFIYDPTLDLQRDKKRKSDVVRLNPTSVVESIKRKVRGFIGDESIPLGVEGQVEELVRQATEPRNLSAMYIGWCAFL